jgi:hypothetical protein
VLENLGTNFILRREERKGNWFLLSKYVTEQCENLHATKLLSSNSDRKREREKERKREREKERKREREKERKRERER